MQLIFLGSGSAFTVGDDNFQSNMLLVSPNGRRLLIDCGSDIRFSLRKCGFKYGDVTDIYISHLHADHVGGMEFMGFSTKFDPRCSRPKLHLCEDLVAPLWERTLSGGMRSLQGKLATLETYFDVQPVKPNGSFGWEGITFQTFSTIHILDGEMEVPSYGLFFEFDGLKATITTDTQFCLDRLWPYYERSNAIFHDCETTPFKSTVHAHYEELKVLPPEIKRKMWLYHYQPGHRPDAVADGFAGFVQPGQSFNRDILKACLEG
ncbi:MAG: ribonuclease Z [Cyanobacteria bacterium SID2]|nr:ribonuclease Z [Cyanobacteria bacterium SID2]MBP0002525.1 ribonuclease Z [Cyanobacteria bacterium SBC]